MKLHVLLVLASIVGVRGYGGSLSGDLNALTTLLQRLGPELTKHVDSRSMDVVNAMTDTQKNLIGRIDVQSINVCC